MHSETPVKRIRNTNPLGPRVNEQKYEACSQNKLYYFNKSPQNKSWVERKRIHNKKIIRVKTTFTSYWNQFSLPYENVDELDFNAIDNFVGQLKQK